MQMTEAEKMLKGATFYVIRSLGGYEAAASYVRVGKSQLERCASVQHPDQFINIATAYSLDLAFGQPVLANCMLAQYRREGVSNGSNTDIQREATRELSEFLLTLMDATEDGHVCQKNQRDIHKEGQDVINVVQKAFGLSGAVA